MARQLSLYALFRWPVLFLRIVRAATPRYETAPITLSITSIDGRRHIDFTSNHGSRRVFLVDPRGGCETDPADPPLGVSNNSCFCHRMPRTPAIEPIGPVISGISHSCSFGYRFPVSLTAKIYCLISHHRKVATPVVQETLSTRTRLSYRCIYLSGVLLAGPFSYFTRQHSSFCDFHHLHVARKFTDLERD